MRSEDELLERSIAGDHAALERLMMLHHARLAGELARKLPANVRGFVSVEDTLQETYVIVFRDITSFQPRGPGSFYGWLSRIAEHRLFDAIKAERAAKRGGGRVRINTPAEAFSSSAIDWLEMLAVHERTPSRSVAGREAVSTVQAALEHVKPDYREALRLRYVEGLPVADTAKRMNRTEGAVCLLCHRGLRQLEQLLGSRTQFFGTGE